MTVHVGLASGAGAVIVSDSQGSTPTSESHGLQKQIVGDGFVIGVAGAMSIVTAILRHVHETNCPAADAQAVVEQFTRDRIRASAYGQFGALAGTSAPTNQIASFNPAVFTSFDQPARFGTIGSGAEFVGIALREAEELGFSIQGAELVDLLFQALRFADAANRSLTVDDQLAVGIVRGGKAYALWDARIGTRFVDARLLQHVPHISATLADLRARVATLRGELVNAVRATSAIWNGPLDASKRATLDLAALSIAHSKTELAGALDAYFNWYDGILGR